MKSNGMFALIILNRNYIGSDSVLLGVTRDGECMKKMLETYHYTILEDVTDVEKAVQDYSENLKGHHIERLHFHYSGHGVESEKVQIDPAQMEDEKTFIGLTPNGGCVTGCEGKQYSFHDLQIELLKCKPEKLTMTLDCCRNARNRSGDQFVKLRYKEPIKNEDKLKMAVFYGTSDLHSASDANTFTQQLYHVWQMNGHKLFILEIVGKVNKSWRDLNILQICQDDIVQCGDNWKCYIWPDPGSSNQPDSSTPSSSDILMSPEAMSMDTSDGPIPENSNNDETMKKVLERLSKLEEDREIYAVPKRKIPKHNN